MTLEHATKVTNLLMFSTSGWWFGPFLFFHSVGNVIIPTDFNSIIFQRVWLKPPTRLLLTIINHIITIHINHYVILTVYYQALVGGEKPPTRHVPVALHSVPVLAPSLCFFFFTRTVTLQPMMLTSELDQSWRTEVRGARARALCHGQVRLW